ncbi:MAG: metalloregulator ArsR/SmtB family transcription factor [Rhodoferax sp.]|nr:metalloregulator ArsR/SmtB family transcription factor [Rhodoferax sp.]
MKKKTNREIKDVLYEQVARIAKALASPKRLEIIELLCQAPKSVEDLARELDISVKLTSAHLKALRESCLVQTERQGKYIVYRIASDQVPPFYAMLRTLAEERLLALQEALREMALSSHEWQGASADALLRKARSGEVVVIDVRPDAEYAHAHLPFARSIPIAELRTRLGELPKDKPVVAYCRGPYCLMSAQAVDLLQAKGFTAFQWRGDVLSLTP